MIYFLLSEKQEAVKIGYSKDEYSLKNRISNLQTANPFELKLLASFEGDVKQELYLHRNLEDYKLNGEWFAVDGALRLLDDLNAAKEVNIILQETWKIINEPKLLGFKDVSSVMTFGASEWALNMIQQFECAERQETPPDLWPKNSFSLLFFNLIQVTCIDYEHAEDYLPIVLKAADKMKSFEFQIMKMVCRKYSAYRLKIEELCNEGLSYVDAHWRLDYGQVTV